MKRLILLPFSALALAACGQAVNAGIPRATPTAVAIHVASNPTLGSYLTTADGRTLYYFTPERDSHATATHIVATGQLLQTWHPLLSPSGLLTTDVTLPGTLTTIPRPDSGRQVTYSDWPLYTFSGDENPGQTNGQGIMGEWFVATTALTEVLVTATPAPTPAPTLAPTPPPTRVPAPRATPRPTPTSCIPGNNGGDHDGDNNGAPSDGDGCQ
jgi:predicted lipoprotein with Yx(FWY)xxD motif